MPVGLYIHIPFCRSKCPYCSFYSVIPHDEAIKNYVNSVIAHLQQYNDTEFDTVYFGGGTPSMTGADYICDIMQNINVSENAEVTVECNPSDCFDSSGFDFDKAASHGINRISLGLQSALDSERKMLGRKAGTIEIEKSIARIYSAGITNISLDVMLGTPLQAAESVNETLDFCISSGAKHISAYMLSIEENTFYGRNRQKYDFPDEDKTAEMYMLCCEKLKEAGMKHYEISNFSFPGYESRHNLKYWHCEEYVGIGPAAHSFLNGKRSFYENDINKFISGSKPIEDGCGGYFEEYAMLALRLDEGLVNEKVKERFGHGIPHEIYEKAEMLKKYNLIKSDESGISLTEKGFLVSNSVIGQLLI